MKNVKKLFKSKSGINDISIIAIILSIFLVTSIMITFVNAEFGVGADEFDEEKLTNDIKSQSESLAEPSGSLTTSLNAFSVLKTVIKLAIFDWGNTLGLPFWMDLFYVILSILFILVIARNIWIGGGA